MVEQPKPEPAKPAAVPAAETGPSLLDRLKEYWYAPVGLLALIALGYKQVDAHKVVKQAWEKGGPGQGSEELVRAALKLLI